MYRWLLYLHVIGVFAFLMAHGVSAGVTFALRRASNNIDRIRSLLQMSAGGYPIAMGALAVIVVTGVVNGFAGHWWKQGWIWTSIGVLIAIIALMSAFGSIQLNKLRLGLGLPSVYNEKPSDVPLSSEEVDGLIKRINPMLLTLIGFGGLGIIAWLMLFKPF